MKKLQLDVEALRIEKFEVLPRELAGEGTVVGQDGALITEWSKCQQETCWNGSCGTGNPCRQCP